MEEKYFKWFDEGKIKECILGEGEYFLLDRDWQTHDRLMIFRYLGKWASTMNKKEKIEEIFYRILKLQKEKINFYLFIYHYSHYCFYNSNIFLNHKKLIYFLKENIKNDINEILNEPELISIIIALQKYLQNDVLFDNNYLVQKLQESFL